MSRPPKKSESLEIRLPYETKQAFMARCQGEGVSASEALRGFIEARLAPPPQARAGRGWLPLALGAAVALAVGATALPSLAGQVDRTGFERFDLDHSGAISAAEFAHLDRNGDGMVSLAEFRGR